MSELKATPGKWRVNTQEGDDCRRAEILTDKKDIADCIRTWSTDEERALEEEEATANAYLMASSKDLYETLDMLLKEYIAERDCLYDSVVCNDGTIQHEGDRQSVAEMDAIIDRCQKTLARARGETTEN